MRPPYGRLKRSQWRQLANQYEIVMWDVLSGDFSSKIDGERCLKKTIQYTMNGSIVLFHDSPKTIGKLKNVLPAYLEHFSNLRLFIQWIMILILLVVGGVMAVLIDLAVLISWSDPPENNLSEDMPDISILVPMRNEASNVSDFIDCIKSLDYPPEKIEVIIGEDRSEDLTAAYLENEIAFDQRFKIVPITREIPGLMAKANVIAQLIPYCHTPYYFITDADVRVPTSWISALLSYHTGGTGVLGGSTVVKVDGLWSSLQNIDWLMAQGLLFVASNKFNTMAVSGTNMMITKAACDAIGGYQRIPYPLTEDIGFLTAAKDQGFSAKNILNAPATAQIAPQTNWNALQRQRIRWIYGALRLPKLMVFLLLIRTLFLVFIVGMIWWKPLIAMTLYMVKFIVDLTLVKRVAIKLNQKVAMLHFICFEAFSCLISGISLFKYLFSKSINWKGRNYS